MVVTLLLGSLLGFLTGLGVGGGSLLVLWQTMVLGTDPVTARSLNILFFLPSAIISCIFRIRQGTLEIRKVLPAIAFGCAAAVIGGLLSPRLDVEILKKGFGILLIAAGIRELTCKSSKIS